MIIKRGRKSWFYLSRGSTLLLLVCLWLSIGLVLSGCPKVCECKWRDGKEVVACRDAHFIDIPRGLDPSTQVLDLRHNNLRILPKDSFVYTGLVNLQKVWLSFCNLMRVEDGAFRKLMNVVELDLSNNYLKSVPTKALMDMGGLREFRIAHNSLTIISSTAFLPTPELVQLDISHNKITVIEPGALRHLIYLEVLDISENKITTLSASEMIPLTVLRVMNLDGNNWHCDCHLKALKKWLDDYEVTPTIPPACSHPRWLMGQAWQILDPDEFVCAPQVTAAAPRVLASEGENVTLVCQVKSEVETTITWLAGDSAIQNTNESLRYFIFEVALPDYNSYISNLTMTGVVPEDQGTYRCVAENRAGYREVNLTLQVSHEVAEVRVANVEPTTYVKSGLVMGISIAAFVFIIMCSLLYCKLRSSGQSEQHEEEKPAIPQTSRASDSDVHSMAGYHIVPTNELDDPPPPRSQPQQPWMVRRGGGSSGGGTPRLDKSSGHHKDHSQTMNVPTSAPSSVSYVEIPKSGIGAARTTLEDRARWKDVIVHSKDILPQSSCARSGSQVSLGSSNPYPDLLDLPRQQGQEVHAQGNFPLHTLNPSYCTMPRTRSKNHGDSSTVAATSLDGPSDSMAQSSFNNTHDSAFRSSSALNLALSEAASHAYAQGHIPLRGHPLLPGAPGLESHDPQALQELIASQRGSCAESSEQGCGQMNGQDPYRFEYHAAQLEKFLQEYRSLQQQLLMMKQSYQATHRTGSAPRLDCCTENRLSPPQGILQPATTTSYPNSQQAFGAPPQTNAPISQPYTTSSQIPPVVPPEAYTTVSPQPFVSISQSAVQYTASPDPQRAASGNPYPDSSQCYVVPSQSYAAAGGSQPYPDPCLTFASPPVPYAPSLPQCHPANAQSYTVPLQIVTSGDMGGGGGGGSGGGGGGGGGEGSPSMCHSSPRCSESSVSPPTVTFPPGNEQHVKPQMLNKGAPPTEPLKSILKKTTASSSSEATGKLQQGRQHQQQTQQQHKQQQLHHPQSKKQQMSCQWKS
ncbi:uncharacterized protein [Macrobrachium rosenbergii]|uniref:uncharacterized protein n=1 Tax=Macrobrachium rosenbergii TaxID=79674 RepID=UPI0034D50342